MKFYYKFSNLLGTVYTKGNLVFSPDGNSIFSPVGNRISVFDLRNNKSSTLPVESNYNYTAIDISPNGCILIAIDEEGEAHLISLISQTIVHKYRFKRKVRAVKFSPDGKLFAVCKENNVFVFKTPGDFTGTYNSFVMERVFHGANDETTCLDWSSDSKILAVGSKDMSVKLYPLEKFENFFMFTLGGHTDIIVNAYFEENSYDLITIGRNGQACLWECAIEFGGLKSATNAEPKAKKKKTVDSDEDDIDTSKTIEKSPDDLSESFKAVQIEESKTSVFKKLGRYYLADEVRKDDKSAVLTSSFYHKKTKILIVGFSNGSFFIYELPDFNLIHSLSISEKKISTICVNNTGDWIGLGCGDLGQLLVWEWQSETYVMKQQGHSSNMTCVSYSPDGQLLATGGEDGKVKLWNITTGFCFITFTEHTAAISSLAFSGKSKFVVSASYDGTVRAFDVIRYRNFRTFTSPRPVQFSCVAVDSCGDFVAVGGQDVFEIYLFSVKTGKLLDILSGHEGPVASLSFSPTLASTTLVSASWDKTVRIWEAIEKGSAHETIELQSDCLCVVFNPNGLEIAVSTLSGQISVFNIKTSLQVSSIEGRNDLGSGRADTDLVTAKQSLQAKAFTTLCYSADGLNLLAAGQSKNVCIYNIAEGMIVKKFEITQNRSLDAVDDFINRRKMTEFGNIALVEEREEREGGNVAIRLPGVRRGDMASRVLKPEVRVFCLQFSPTGQQWAAATTEGLLIYALNTGLVFDPWDLQIGITPQAVRKALKEEDYLNALIMGVKLNEAELLQEIIENIPVKDIELTVTSLSEPYIEKLITIVSNNLSSSRHLEFYLIWVESILTIHGPRITSKKVMPALLSLEKNLITKHEQISKMAEHNKYLMEFILGFEN